ncbi:hypothetical protein BpHYR1_015445 [Brachionus plicatilis]|uniref:Uncharacterized protein n=1 Tax=Brachionus plicatilis TaxID=10195 RepID=A0A3M7P3D3_BRAPC|nr:hypothetical protein BpHYR1_015445 [Brachionus plicatilis]
MSTFRFNHLCINKREKNSKSSEKELIEKIVNNVRDLIGPVACFKQAVVIPVTIEDAEIKMKVTGYTDEF